MNKERRKQLRELNVKLEDLKNNLEDILWLQYQDGL